MTDHDHDTYSCGCEGRSGIPLTTLQSVLQQLAVPDDHPVRGFLPTLEPSLRNTVHSLKTVCMKVWAKHMDARASISLKSTDAPEGCYNAIAHVSGFDNEGQSLSAERYSISLKFGPNGRISQRHISPQVNGSPEGVNALLIAIDKAEQSLSSKQWQGRWNSMHLHYRSIYLTSMNYYVHHAEGASVIDMWITIAQRCGIRAIRYDQPQWAVVETLGDLLKQKLEEAEATLTSDKRTTARTANSRLASAVELGETIQSLKAVLGDVGERMAQSLETLKGKWAQIRGESQQLKKRQLQTYYAITPAGREFMSSNSQDLTYVCISPLGLEHLPQLRSALPSIPSDSLDAKAIRTLISMSERPEAFHEERVPVLLPLIQEGWCEPQTIDAHVWSDALDPLRLAQRPLSAQDAPQFDTIPPHYRSLFVRSFKE